MLHRKRPKPPEPPEKINGITDKVVLEAILGEDKCFRTRTKPTHKLLTS